MLTSRKDSHGDEKNEKKEYVPCMHGLVLLIFFLSKIGFGLCVYAFLHPRIIQAFHMIGFLMKNIFYTYHIRPFKRSGHLENWQD